MVDGAVGGVGAQVRQKPCWRLKSVPISLALPWGINISDLAGHIPPPAGKIVVEASERTVVDGDDEAVAEKVGCPAWAGGRRPARRRTSDRRRSLMRVQRHCITHRPPRRVEGRQRPGLLSGVHCQPRTLGDGDRRLQPEKGARYTVHWKILGWVPIQGAPGAGAPIPPG